MKRPMIYGLEVALFCPRCRRELLLENFWEKMKPEKSTLESDKIKGIVFQEYDHPGKAFFDFVNRACVQHDIGRECIVDVIDVLEYEGKGA